tara:strand:+ start:591 stop:731 length:141 start_codon:yes stop_codon:yes gene_type:complete
MCNQDEIINCSLAINERIQENGTKNPIELLDMKRASILAFFYLKKE